MTWFTCGRKLNDESIIVTPRFLTDVAGVFTPQRVIGETSSCSWRRAVAQLWLWRIQTQTVGLQPCSHLIETCQETRIGWLACIWCTEDVRLWIVRVKMSRYTVWQALNSLSVHVKFIAIVPGAYPGKPKCALRLSWRSQMLAPATTYRRDSREVAK